MAPPETLSAALADRYQFQRELGVGGMATVYLAEDLKHGRKVAIKVLKPELAAVLGAERFVVEIKTTASLQHPHILPLFDSGTAHGFLFYVMPYIEGETIRERLNRETQFGIDDAVRIAREVADALDYAHRHGVIHRDIKPENILLHDGRAMVMDFGIALAVSAAAGGRMTETGLSLGTPHYMSPEQATAEKEISPRSDIYSLATVLYEMLAGNPPFTGASAQQIIMKIITEQPDLVTKHRKSVPPNVSAAIAQALEKLPADRLPSASAFRAALGDVTYTHGVGTTAYATPARSFRRAFIMMSAVAAALLLIGLRGWLRPASLPDVARNSIIIWDNMQSRPSRVGRALGISPDGRTMVYVDSADGGLRLFAKERDQTEATPLAGTEAVDRRAGPTFSPDGRWIAFSTREDKLLKIPREGGAAITVADGVHQSIAWMEDGTILFDTRQYHILAVNENGGPTRLVYNPNTADTTGRLVVSITPLPGGESALIGVCKPSCSLSELLAIDVKTSRTTLVAEDALKGWALPGGRVAYVRRDGAVLAGPFNARTLAFSSPPAPMFEGVRTTVNTADIVVSPEGTVIYVPGRAVTANPPYEPVWVTRSGEATPVDPAWRIALASPPGNTLGLSPRGDRLAIVIARAGNSGEHDIWIKQLDKPPHAVTRLTTAGQQVMPLWSADGTTVMYTSGARNGATEGFVFRRRADAIGPVDTLLRLPRGIGDMTATPVAGQFLVRLGPNANYPSSDIALWREGDSEVTNLVSTPNFQEDSPVISPDGKWLAYVSNESSQREVYVQPWPNVDAGRVKVSQSGGDRPTWGHSSRELFYLSGGSMISAAVLPGATFNMGEQSVLFGTTGFRAVTYVVEPGDKRFVMLRPVTEDSAEASPTERLVQITNWLREVERKLAVR